MRSCCPQYACRHLPAGPTGICIQPASGGERHRQQVHPAPDSVPGCSDTKDSEARTEDSQDRDPTPDVSGLMAGRTQPVMLSFL